MKALLPWIISVLAMVLLSLWIGQTEFDSESIDVLMALPILITTGIVLVVVWIVIKNKRERQPIRDEMSRRMNNQAASISFFISLYMWLLLMYASNGHYLDPNEALGTGILGMAVILVCVRIFYQIRGLRND